MLKSVFLVVYPGGDDSNLIGQKLRRVLDGFGATQHEFPASQDLYAQRLNQIELQLVNIENVTQRNALPPSPLNRC